MSTNSAYIANCDEQEKTQKSQKLFLAQNKVNKANKAKDANSASFADPEIFISGYFALLPNKAT